jgi:formate hydrogenlyase subunit 6/NADH:ubiquinone oxidoreductase subunit I
MGTSARETRTFHLGRALHLAGRCVGCNECERVCPMNIPISLLNKKLAQEMEALYDHQPGFTAAVSPLILTLRETS